MLVKNLKLREILASNAKKTIEIEIETEKGVVKASVPIGTSKGKYEVKYLPISEIINKFQLVRRIFRGKEFFEQGEVDNLLKLIDKTPNFKEIGGNLVLAISSAFLKAFALNEGEEIFKFLSETFSEKISIPKPICNIAGGWRTQSDIQEYLILPVHQQSFFESVKKISKIYIEFGERLKEIDKNFNFGKNLESAWVTSLPAKKVLDLIKNFVDENLKIGLDFAASQFWNGKKYSYPGKNFLPEDQISFVKEVVKNYDVFYIEDPFHEDDFVSFSLLTSHFPNKIIAGDDLFASNPERLKIGIEKKATNAIVIKPNQIGLITKVIQLIKTAKKNKITTIISHRSGETDDNLICHLACGLSCEFIKIGIAGERIFKINEMIRIEEKIS